MQQAKTNKNMKTRKVILSAAAVAAIGATVCSMMVANRQATADKTSREGVVAPRNQVPPRRPDPVKVAIDSSPILPGERTVSETELQAGSLAAKVDTNPKPQSEAPQINSTSKPKAEIQDPVARVALSFVGIDRDAEAYWEQAINNPDLPAEERKDLIEDLNEDGLSDPQHPAPEDMLVVVNRLLLIEELAPYAMDQVNLDAFKEAHKDLVDMLNGVPVR
jgi:hypothetical protein